MLRITSYNVCYTKLLRLVLAVTPAPPWHQAPGELVDDNDLAILNHVVDIAAEQGMSLERLVDVVELV